MPLLRIADDPFHIICCGSIVSRPSSREKRGWSRAEMIVTLSFWLVEVRDSHACMDSSAVLRHGYSCFVAFSAPIGTSLESRFVISRLRRRSSRPFTVLLLSTMAAGADPFYAVRELVARCALSLTCCSDGHGCDFSSGSLSIAGPLAIDSPIAQCFRS